MIRVRTREGPKAVAGLAVDHDRTLTDAALHPVEEAVQAVAKLRSAGLTTILATGRAEAQLDRARLEAAFGLVILEGGALAGPWGRLEPPSIDPTAWRRFVARLGAEKIPFRENRASLSIDADRGPAIREWAEARPFELRRNRDRLDVTPRGVNKGTAFRRLRQTQPGRAGIWLAFGDADNDAPLFEAADLGIAVGNATDGLRRVAHETAPGYGGMALVRFLEERLLPSHQARDVRV